MDWNVNTRRFVPPPDSSLTFLSNFTHIPYSGKKTTTLLMHSTFYSFYFKLLKIFTNKLTSSISFSTPFKLVDFQCPVFFFNFVYCIDTHTRPLGYGSITLNHFGMKLRLNNSHKRTIDGVDSWFH